MQGHGSKNWGKKAFNYIAIIKNWQSYFTRLLWERQLWQSLRAINRSFEVNGCLTKNLRKGLTGQLQTRLTVNGAELKYTPRCTHVELIITAFLIDHNILIRVIDYLSYILPRTFRNSAITREFACKKTKPACLAYKKLCVKFKTELINGIAKTKHSCDNRWVNWSVNNKMIGNNYSSKQENDLFAVLRNELRSTSCRASKACTYLAPPSQACTTLKSMQLDTPIRYTKKRYLKSDVCFTKIL